MKYYLAYGSNLNVDQMLSRCPGAVQIGRVYLPDHKLTFRGNTRHYGVANIEPSPGSTVPVAIWSITDSDERNLDLYEGYPRLYTKKWFDIDIRGRTIRAMAYVMSPGHLIVSPSTGYLHVIAEGYAAFGFNIDGLYEAAIATTHSK